MSVSAIQRVRLLRTPLRELQIRVIEAFRQVPARLRRRQFWAIQAMVLVATGAHYGAEAAGYSTPEGEVHQVAVALYMIPLLYAALSFDWEGTLMTGLLGAVLVSPSIWIWHHSQLLWVAELLQLGMIMSVGMVVAWRVNLESQQRLIAERTSASLTLLNWVGASLSHTLDVEQRLPQVISGMREALGLSSVAIWLEPEASNREALVFEDGSPKVDLSSCLTSYGLARGSTPGTLHVDRTVIALLSAESGPIGFLASLPLPVSALTDEQKALLETIGREVAFAVENARLYRQHQEEMRSYVQQVTQAQENERMRMARELHDDTLQELVLLVRKLEDVAAAEDADVAQHGEAALRIARDLGRSVRNFSQNLRPSILDDLGMLSAIEMVVDDTDRLLTGGARIHISGQPRSVEPPVGLALFRIAQEALRNVEKHAQAHCATIKIGFDAADISMAISDDGVGFTVPRSVTEFARLGKLGVLGIKERAELVGGTFDVESAIGEGTTVTVRIPGAWAGSA